MWCRPDRLALSGARQQPLVPLPVRAGFSYKKKIARREYVRVNLATAGTARSRRSSFRARAPGYCRRWSDTDGLVELGEDISRVEPGQTVGFLSYASLI